MWVRYVHTKIYTAIQNRGEEKLKNTRDSTGQKKFTSVNFTAVSRNLSNLTKEEEEEENKKKKFPTVYVQKLQGRSVGKTLEDAQVNGIVSTYQIKVTTNTNQTDAEIIADVMADIMVDMGFEMVGEPIPDNDKDTYINFSRWQRTIGYNDKLNF